MYLYLTIVSILQNVIRKILRRRPCQNFLPGVLCVTQWPGLPTGMSHRAACGLSQVALTPALWPSRNTSSVFDKSTSVESVAHELH